MNVSIRDMTEKIQDTYDHEEISVRAEQPPRDRREGADGRDTPNEVAGSESSIGAGGMLGKIDRDREIVSQDPQIKASAANSEVCRTDGGKPAAVNVSSGSSNKSGSTSPDLVNGNGPRDERNGAQSQGSELDHNQQGRISEGLVYRWRRALHWKIRRARISFELKPNRVQHVVSINRRVNKLGALVYGPFAFTAGVMLTSGHSKWWLLVPGCWFTGMLLSHLVFDRCVLNEIVIRLRRFNKVSKPKADIYTRRGTTMGWGRARSRTAIKEEIFDMMPTPDIKEEKKKL